MRRGDIATAVLPGDYGKPRPVVVLQDDRLEGLPSLVVCPITSVDREDLAGFRVRLEPGERTGLRVGSEVMIDKISAIARSRMGHRIGNVDEFEMAEIETSLSILLGLA